MGAEYCTEKVKAVNKEELTKKYNELVEQALYDNGHSGYSGSIAESAGLTIHEEEMSLDDAEEYLDTNTKKWGDTIAVKIKDKDDLWLLGGTYSC